MDYTVSMPSVKVGGQTNTCHMSRKMMATLSTFAKILGNIKLPCSNDCMLCVFEQQLLEGQVNVLVEFAMLLVLTGEGRPLLQS